jgi:tRNA A37 methylthiotransferase MiaB
LEDKRILPYFHLSVQSASDKILKLMWRHYDKSQLIYVVENLLKLKKDVPINIWADIIVGFPSETQEDFQQTLEFAQKYITKLHVFPFSPHQIWDTVPASKFPNQVDLQTKKQREHQLIEVCDKNYKKLIEATKGLKVQVLIESNNQWWTQNYLKFQAKTEVPSWSIIYTTF